MTKEKVDQANMILNRITELRNGIEVYRMWINSLEGSPIRYSAQVKRPDGTWTEHIAVYIPNEISKVVIEMEIAKIESDIKGLEKELADL